MSHVRNGGVISHNLCTHVCLHRNVAFRGKKWPFNLGNLLIYSKSFEMRFVGRKNILKAFSPPNNCEKKGVVCLT